MEHVRAETAKWLLPLIGVVLSISGIVYWEPAPVDMGMALLLLVALAGGYLRIRRDLDLPAAWLGLFVAGNLISLAVSADLTRALWYIGVTIYLLFTWWFFVGITAEHGVRAMRVLMTGYTIAGVISVLVAGVGLFGWFPEQLTLYGRPRALFKDPNVFGPFLVPITLYAVSMMESMLERRQRGVLLLWGGVFILTSMGVILSLSRGAWLNYAAAWMAYVVVRLVVSGGRWSDLSGKVKLWVASFCLLAVVSAGFMAWMTKWHERRTEAAVAVKTERPGQAVEPADSKVALQAPAQLETTTEPRQSKAATAPEPEELRHVEEVFAPAEDTVESEFILEEISREGLTKEDLSQGELLHEDLVQAEEEPGKPEYQPRNIVKVLVSRLGLQGYDLTYRIPNQIAAFKVGLANPVGIGPGQADIGTHLTISPHNTYLRVWVEYGWLGAFGFLGFGFLTLRKAYRLALRTGGEMTAVVVLAGLIGIAMNSIFIDTLHWRHAYILLALPWALDYVRARAAAEHPQGEVVSGAHLSGALAHEGRLSGARLEGFPQPSGGLREVRRT